MHRNGDVSPVESQIDPYAALSREDLIVLNRTEGLEVEIHSKTGEEEQGVVVYSSRSGIASAGSSRGD